MKQQFLQIIESLLVRRKIIKDKQWISLKEFRAYSFLVMWITSTRNTPLQKHILCLEDRIIKLWNNNGPTFTFNYLKGCNHILIRYFARTPLSSTFNSKCLVKVDPHYGLPTIFPRDLRKSISEWNRTTDLNKIVALLTFIGVYRSFPTKVSTDLSSVIDPFDGISQTLDENLIKRSLSDLGIRKIAKSKGKLVSSDRSGPNSHNSTWGAEIDAFALLHSEPFSFFIEYCLKSRSYLILTWYLVIIILGSPYYLVSRLFRSKPVNGRLSVVYNQAGKARVVAMTNWWIQCIFKGLHDKIFDLLRDNPCDATFDQLGRLQSYISNNKYDGKIYYCYDLSSATDRLPLILQKDILNSLDFPGTCWANIISSIDWKYKSKFIRYSVGQPMGAYSSWAMLALTHHVIVRASALRLGLNNFTDYLVLGDDIVIGNPEVAKSYLELMSTIGVKINLSKSVISSEIIEFAKRWINADYDISPIGSGLILQSIRERSSFVTLVTEVWNRKLLSWMDMKRTIRLAPKVVKPKLQFAIIHSTILELNRYYNESVNEKFSITDLIHYDKIKELYPVLSYASNMVNTHLLDRMYVSRLLTHETLQSFTRVYRVKASSIFRTNFRRILFGLKQILFYSWRVSSLRLGLPDLFDLVLLPIKPGLYIHITILIRSAVDLLKHYILHKILMFNIWFYEGIRPPVPTLRSGAELWYYSHLLDIESLIHIYEEDVSSKKRLSKLLAELSHDNRDLMDYLRSMKVEQ